MDMPNAKVMIIRAPWDPELMPMSKITPLTNKNRGVQTDSLLGACASLSNFLRMYVDPFRVSVMRKSTPFENVEGSLYSNYKEESTVGQQGRPVWLRLVSPLFVQHPIGRKGDCLEEETGESSKAEDFHKDKDAHSLCLAMSAFCSI